MSTDMVYAVKTLGWGMIGVFLALFLIYLTIRMLVILFPDKRNP